MSTQNKFDVTPPPWHIALPRILLRLVIVFIVAFLIKLGFDWLMDRITLLEEDAAARAMTSLLVTALLGYAVLIAIPFMPGIEIGLALLVIQGAAAAPFVYLATVAGLLTSFVVGQTLSLDWLHKLFADLHMLRACALLEGIKNTDRDDRLSNLTNRLPGWLAAPLVEYRYVTVALLINMPGNAVIGGGGGILLLAGITRLFRTAWMVITVALATLPVPLGVWLMGSDVLP